MKKIPYGISDFKLLKEENYYFVDKTNYIEKLENYNSRFLMFLRPRRFGKSLFIAILEAYYDKFYKDEFDEIFKDTYIIDNKTPEVSSYLVLRFDFSAIDISDVEESFKYDLQLTLKSFVKRYNLNINFENSSPISMLRAIFDYIQNNSSLKLYLLIDEYDNFVNKLLLNSKNDYLNIVSQKTAYFKQFFTVLKAGASGNNAPIKRMFITGVTPMTMYDVTSGFNIGDNISLHKDFNNLIGFNNDELVQILEDFELDKKVDIEILKEWYNNYKFNDKSESIYNTDMILYFINKFMAEDELPKEMIDINVRSDYSKLKKIIYTNRKLNGNFNTLQTLIGGESISISNLVQDFSALDLEKENNFKSFMFYLGLVTIEDRRLKLNLKIPNETVKRIDIDFLKDALEIEKIFTLNVDKLSDYLAEFALNGDIEVFKYFASMIKDNTGIRDYIYNEQTIKSMYLAYLSLTPYFVAKSEFEMNKGFCDIFLKPLNPFVEYIGLVEFKYIKRGEKASKKRIKSLVQEAINQLIEYERDEIVTTYIDDGLKVEKIVIIFWGWEMVWCEKI